MGTDENRVDNNVAAAIFYGSQLLSIFGQLSSLPLSLVFCGYCRGQELRSSQIFGIRKRAIEYACVLIVIVITFTVGW